MSIETDSQPVKHILARFINRVKCIELSICYDFGLYKFVSSCMWKFRARYRYAALIIRQTSDVKVVFLGGFIMSASSHE